MSTIRSRTTFHVEDTSTLAISVENLQGHPGEVTLSIGLEGRLIPSTVIVFFKNATVSEVVSTLEECLAKVKEENGLITEEVL